jgi:5'(3')-deoxyribonucleotidase
VTIFVDQDGPLADFDAAARARGLAPGEAKMLPGFYRSLPLVAQAREAVLELVLLPGCQVFVATKIPDENPLAASEKIAWLHQHLPELEERIIITPNKACLGTQDDFLIDDRAHKADAAFFRGRFLHFGSSAFPDWHAVLHELRRCCL